MLVIFVVEDNRMSVKRPTDSLVTMTELVMPNDTNTVGNLFGGRLMHWMDISGALSAAKHSGYVCVTASVNNISFRVPIELGEVVTLIARVVRSFNTSMEVHIEVYKENLKVRDKIKCNEAYFTYVAIDENKKPSLVDEIQPLSDEESLHYVQALIRRQLKLLMAGKIKLEEAPELQNQINEWEKDTIE